MECLHCFSNFYPGIHQHSLYDQTADVRCFVLYQACPACKKYNIFGKFIPKTDSVSLGYKHPLYEKDPQSEKDVFMIYPKHKGHKKLSDHIPESYRKEVDEAYNVLVDSPKASAALARRLLQRLLEEVCKIEPTNLKIEIDQLLESGTLPSYLREQIDAVRNIGNFGAHPLDSKSTGLIVDVEPGEADWTLSILEEPAENKIRRQKLNSKLSEYGKPKMQQ